MIDSAGSHSFCVSSLKRHRWTLFSVFFFSYMASFGLMGIRIPHIETLKPLNLNHSFISHLCLSLTTHSHLSSLISTSLPHRHQPPLSAHSITLCFSLTLPRRHRPPRATQIVACSLNHSLPHRHRPPRAA